MNVQIEYRKVYLKSHKVHLPLKKSSECPKIMGIPLHPVNPVYVGEIIAVRQMKHSLSDVIFNMVV